MDGILCLFFATFSILDSREIHQGAILTKAALNLMGLPGGFTRLPRVDATEAQTAQLKVDLQAGGVKLK